MLKLFRDYLFHQSSLDGTPLIDMGHVVASLNKLDTADREQILLSSRNGQDILVASFFDINRCGPNFISRGALVECTSPLVI